LRRPPLRVSLRAAPVRGRSSGCSVQRLARRPRRSRGRVGRENVRTELRQLNSRCANLNKTIAEGVFPDRQARAVRVPDVHRLSVRARAACDPRQEIVGQRARPHALTLMHRSRHTEESPDVRGFCRALFRTRTGDPSLPCGPGGNRSQPTATDLARLSGFRRRSVCHRLPPVAPALLHKCSILCNPLRQQSCRARSC
jgi:hypothetical protein